MIKCASKNICNNTKYAVSQKIVSSITAFSIDNNNNKNKKYLLSIKSAY